MDEKSIQAKTLDDSGVMNHQVGIPCFVSVTELGANTGLSRSSINRQIKAKRIPVVKIGNRLLIPRKYLDTLQAIAEAAIKEVKNEK